MQRSLPKETQPLFLFSLPRTGSTLLQRILGSHPEIATASEPWFLLPYLYSVRETGVNAEYEHATMARGVRGFSREYLPGGTEGVPLRGPGARPAAAPEGRQGHRYFLDKTPRYHHIATDVITLFREGKFVFLWRHPVAVAASMMETFAGGKWNLQACSADLFAGVVALVEAYQEHRDTSAPSATKTCSRNQSRSCDACSPTWSWSSTRTCSRTSPSWRCGIPSTGIHGDGEIPRHQQGAAGEGGGHGPRPRREPGEVPSLSRRCT